MFEFVLFRHHIKCDFVWDWSKWMCKINLCKSKNLTNYVQSAANQSIGVVPLWHNCRFHSAFVRLIKHILIEKKNSIESTSKKLDQISRYGYFTFTKIHIHRKPSILFHKKTFKLFVLSSISCCVVVLELCTTSRFLFLFFV